MVTPNAPAAPIFAGKTDLRTLTIDELRQLVRMADSQWETLWTGPGERPGVEMDAQAALDLMVAADRAGWVSAESFVGGDPPAGERAWRVAQDAARARAGVVDEPPTPHIPPDLLTADGAIGW